MNDLARRYLDALKAANELIEALSAIQQAFPSSTNHDRRALAYRIQRELELGLQDREREARLGEEPGETHL